MKYSYKSILAFLFSVILNGCPNQKKVYPDTATSSLKTSEQTTPPTDTPAGANASQNQEAEKQENEAVKGELKEDPKKEGKEEEEDENKEKEEEEKEKDEEGENKEKEEEKEKRNKVKNLDPTEDAKKMTELKAQFEQLWINKVNDTTKYDIINRICNSLELENKQSTKLKEYLQYNQNENWIKNIVVYVNKHKQLVKNCLLTKLPFDNLDKIVDYMRDTYSKDSDKHFIFFNEKCNELSNSWPIDAEKELDHLIANYIDNIELSYVIKLLNNLNAGDMQFMDKSFEETLKNKLKDGQLRRLSFLDYNEFKNQKALQATMEKKEQQQKNADTFNKIFRQNNKLNKKDKKKKS